VSPSPTRISDEWREMLKLYELTSEDVAELNKGMNIKKNNAV